VTRSNISNEDQVVGLLRTLVAIELWRGGLSQEEIRKRLGVAKTKVSGILKGVARHIAISDAPSKKT